MKSFWKNPLILDPAIALAATHVVLLPIAWYLERSPIPPGTFIGFALRPLTLYLSFAAITAGLVEGYHRRKCLRTEQALRELAQERECLLHVLAHDLAGSVGGSRSMLSILAKPGKLAANPETCTENIRCVEHALGDAMELLALTRRLMAVENGKMELVARPIVLEGLLKDFVNRHAAMGEVKGVTLKLNVEPGCREAMVEPVSLTGCVLQNLVANAVKFSLPGGEVRIGLRQSGNCLRLDVTNLGPSIEDDRAAALFSFSGKTSTRGTTGEAGTGFGLPLARRFARLMGGDVHFSQVPAGSGLCSIRFSVILPTAVERAKPRRSLSLVPKHTTPAAA